MHKHPALGQTYLIAEIHPQFSGDIQRAQTIMQQCKLGGADAVKVQLYDSQALFGNDERNYVQIEKDELQELKQYCDNLGIDLFASIFTADRVQWCEDLGFKYYKIASRTVNEDPALCAQIFETGKPVLISLGMWDWQAQGVPFEYEHAIYFYCVAEYPTATSKIVMPDFPNTIFQGYSDHTIGIGASVYALARGATFIEKHFTTNKSLHLPTEMGHAGSMDLEDLRQLRYYADIFSLLKSRGG
ncbi:MAG: N-acetylneuraminate synthase family protein [Anaerolineales bacterium]|nr:N-acetylneuraminate synthase family protein [Anaerolineales bacterium]